MQTQLDFFTKRLNFPKPKRSFSTTLFEKESKSLIAIRSNICYGDGVQILIFKRLMDGLYNSENNAFLN